MTARRERVANIGERGAARRRRGGFFWIAFVVAAFAIMHALDVPRAARLALVLPVGLAAAGFLQAREKT